MMRFQEQPLYIIGWKSQVPRPQEKGYYSFVLVSLVRLLFPLQGSCYSTLRTLRRNARKSSRFVLFSEFLYLSHPNLWLAHLKIKLHVSRYSHCPKCCSTMLTLCFLYPTMSKIFNCLNIFAFWHCMLDSWFSSDA